MAKPVFLTPSAQEDLDKVLSYLSENWGKSVLENFLALYEAKICLISEYPSRYPFINKKIFLRKAVLTNHNMILYREEKGKIEIISIFDTRQHPDNIKKLG